MKSLTVTDLNTRIDAEPRILDVTLGECLGMAQPLNLRGKIKDNLAEISRYGGVFTESVKTSATGGRPSIAYYLNEPQAILLCMFSNTARAADVRHEVITVFMAHRYGRLSSSVDAHDNLVARLEQILDIDERAKKLDTAIAMVDDMRRRADAHAADLGTTASAIRRMLAGPATQPIQPHAIRRIVDARDRRNVGIEMLASGATPTEVSEAVGVQDKTARKWLKLLKPNNDN